MQFTARALLLVSLAITFAKAQTNVPQVQHVIVVIQENRTPDNLFQLDQTLINNGGHIASQGLCLTPNHSQVQVQLSPASLETCWDTYHSHDPDWTTMWDNGAMDGACQIGILNRTCGVPQCSNQTVGEYCPAMTYVQNSYWSWTHPARLGYLLNPYLDC